MIGLVQLRAGVLQLLLPVAVVAPAVIELFPRVGKLALRLTELLVGLGLRVIQLPLRVIQLFCRLGHEGIVPQRGTLIAKGLQRVDDAVDVIVVLIVEGGHLRRAGNARVGRRIVVERERLARQVEIRLHRAAADRGGAALDRDIHR